jgi:hypothetical protein
MLTQQQINLAMFLKDNFPLKPVPADKLQQCFNPWNKANSLDESSYYKYNKKDEETRKIGEFGCHHCKSNNIYHDTYKDRYFFLSIFPWENSKRGCYVYTGYPYFKNSFCIVTNFHTIDDYKTIFLCCRLFTLYMERMYKIKNVRIQMNNKKRRTIDSKEHLHLWFVVDDSETYMFHPQTIPTFNIYTPPFKIGRNGKPVTSKEVPEKPYDSDISKEYSDISNESKNNWNNLEEISNTYSLENEEFYIFWNFKDKKLVIGEPQKINK